MQKPEKSRMQKAGCFFEAEVKNKDLVFDEKGRFIKVD